MRLYGRRFWPSLALGIPPSILNLLARTLDETALLVVVPVAGGLLLSASYLGAVALAAERPVRVWQPLLGGLLVFLPFPFLVAFFILPGLAWLAALGLVVPVLALERSRLRVRVPARLQARPRRLRPRARLAGDARDPRLPDAERPLLPPARHERPDAGDRVVRREPRGLAAPLPRRRPPVLRPGSARQCEACTTAVAETCRIGSTRAGSQTGSRSGSSTSRSTRATGRSSRHATCSSSRRRTPTGKPQCSYKGGEPGFVRVLDEQDDRLPELRRERHVPLDGERARERATSGCSSSTSRAASVCA